MFSYVFALHVKEEFWKEIIGYIIFNTAQKTPRPTVLLLLRLKCLPCRCPATAVFSGSNIPSSSIQECSYKEAKLIP
jgi:hypothetical protein